MKWKGNREDSEFTKGTVDDDDFEEDAYPIWEKQKTFSITDALLRKIEIPLVVMAVALVGVIALFFLSTAGQKDTIDGSRVVMLEQKLAAMEDRLLKIEGLHVTTEAVGEQKKALDSLQLKVSKLETAVAARMDQLASDLSALTKKTASAPPAAPVARQEAPAKPAAEKIRHHQVQAGDTLFSIGQRYGVTVEELMRLNNLSRGKTIYPGQQLIVGSSGG